GPQPRLSSRQSQRPQELPTCVPCHRLRRHLSSPKLPPETSERTRRLPSVAPSPHPVSRKAPRGSPAASFATNTPKSSGAGSSSPTTIDWIHDTFEPATG
ncbi:hypothetical protein IscW_ISCW010479, partial [Ixodes scapularis]